MSRVKRARIEATEALATETQSGYRHVQRNIASSSRNMEGFTKRVLSESSGLSSACDSHRVAASTHHANLYDATQALVENAMKEDTPTGLTPRKRRWEYMDEWSLTETRDILLKNWRRQGSGTAKRQKSPADHLSPPDGDEDQEEDQNEEAENVPAEKDIEMETEELKIDPETLPLSSSPPLTLSSSHSSTSTAVLPAPTRTETLPKRKTSEYLKSGLPTLGLLTERPANIVVNRRRVLR